MLHRSDLRSTIAVIVFFGMTGCDSSAEVRTKVTVELETPAGIGTGAGVWSWRLTKPLIGISSPYQGVFRGEAVPVTLPDGRMLFVLAKGQEMLAERQFRDLGPTGLGADRIANVRAIAKRVGETRVFTCHEANDGSTGPSRRGTSPCPEMVFFGNVNDPATVETFDPRKMPNALGPGVKIKAIRVEITDSPVSIGISKKFSWWDQYKDRHFDGSSVASEKFTDQNPAARYSSGTFSTEFNK